MPTLSCSLIVRNAQQSLDRVLASVRLYVDELVVVDTGSTDDTIGVAGQYADRVETITWPESFAAARNKALELCTGEWVMYLDSDDELLNGAAIRPAIEATNPNVGMFLLRYVTAVDRNGDPEMDFWRERIVRQGYCTWKGRAHEVLLPTVQTHYERLAEPWVLHHGHGSSKTSLARNIALLHMDLKDDPKETRTMFYLGRDLILLGRLDQGRKMLQRYMKTATWPDEMYIAQSLISYCYRYAGLYKEAFDADVQLLYIKPTWPGAYFQMAEDCYYLKQWDRSAHFCAIGQSLPPPQTNLFVSRSAYTYDWIIYQVVALYNLGRVDEAVALTEHALTLNPDDTRHRFNQAYFAQKSLAG